MLIEKPARNLLGSGRQAKHIQSITRMFDIVSRGGTAEIERSRLGAEWLVAAPARNRHTYINLPYVRWQEKGCPEGMHEEHWLSAEQELTAIER